MKIKEYLDSIESYFGVAIDRSGINLEREATPEEILDLANAIMFQKYDGRTK